MTGEFVPTGIATADVPPGGLVVADVRGTRIAIANVGGTYYAFDDTCTHQQCSLAEGDLAGNDGDVHVSWRGVRRPHRRRAGAAGAVSGQGVPHSGRGWCAADCGLMGAHVIVGASMAGATAAITLREEGAGAITVIGEEPEAPVRAAAPLQSLPPRRGDIRQCACASGRVLRRARH